MAFSISSTYFTRCRPSSFFPRGCTHSQHGLQNRTLTFQPSYYAHAVPASHWKGAIHRSGSGVDVVPHVNFHRFSTTTTLPPHSNPSFAPIPPTSLTAEVCLSAQDAMKLFIEHGIGRQKLESIASEKKQQSTSLVERWQKMVAVYLETQCHVIALLGYTPDERGLALYTQHLSKAVSLSSPEIQDRLRISGRDTYRMVLAGAFDIPSLLSDQKIKGEVSIVDARNIMHKVSLRMHDPELLEKVAKRCSNIGTSSTGTGPEAQQLEMAQKHAVVQEVMVTDVYLSKGSNGLTLVQECGFGDGEEGYVRMQSAMAEHQGDPLITQYVGSAIMKLLQSAGIDIDALQKQAMATMRA